MFSLNSLLWAESIVIMIGVWFSFSLGEKKGEIQHTTLSGEYLVGWILFTLVGGVIGIGIFSDNLKLTDNPAKALVFSAGLLNGIIALCFSLGFWRGRFVRKMKLAEKSETTLHKLCGS